MKLRKGAGFIIVIAALVFITAFTGLIIREVRQSVFENQALALTTRAYYLNSEACSASVSALLTDSKDLLENGTMPRQDTMTHTSNGTVLGKSTVNLTRQTHKYYGNEMEWVVGNVVTEIPDDRADALSGIFTYKGSFMMLVENPIVTLYNIDPDSLD